VWATPDEHGPTTPAALGRPKMSMRIFYLFKHFQPIRI
jgi:hypothetical protein